MFQNVASKGAFDDSCSVRRAAYSSHQINPRLYGFFETKQSGKLNARRTLENCSRFWQDKNACWLLKKLKVRFWTDFDQCRKKQQKKSINFRIARSLNDVTDAAKSRGLSEKSVIGIWRCWIPKRISSAAARFRANIFRLNALHASGWRWRETNLRKLSVARAARKSLSKETAILKTLDILGQTSRNRRWIKTD